MTTHDREQVAVILAATAEMFNRPLTQLALQLMCDALDGMTAADVAAAVKAHLRGPEGRFFPTPAHILSAVRGDSEAAAALALSRGRRYGEDPIANRVILAMGGESGCATMEAGVWAGQFRRMYVALHSAGMGPTLSATRGFLAPGETLLGVTGTVKALLAAG